ncbi:MAG: PIN domain-containing protein [Gammaproteobacteria bacterium]|nr:MAG: PIN domain-containing protein [Gammaproteobacteria bacterium]
MYLLDTDICIYTIKRQPVSVIKRLEALGAGGAMMSAITWHELVYGAEASGAPRKNRSALDALAQWVPVVDYDAEAAVATGKLRAQLRAVGKPIGAYDAQIAGHALSRGWILVSNNQREFVRVKGLKFENWVD